MEHEIREKVPDLRTTRVVCRSGSPIDIADVALSSPDQAQSIIVLSSERCRSRQRRDQDTAGIDPQRSRWTACRGRDHQPGQRGHSPHGRPRSSCDHRQAEHGGQTHRSDLSGIGCCSGLYRALRLRRRRDLLPPRPRTRRADIRRGPAPPRERQRHRPHGLHRHRHAQPAAGHPGRGQLPDPGGRGRLGPRNTLDQHRCDRRVGDHSLGGRCRRSEPCPADRLERTRENRSRRARQLCRTRLRLDRLGRVR